MQNVKNIIYLVDGSKNSMMMRISRREILSLKIPVDIGRKLNVSKTFRISPERLLNVLYTFNLRPVSSGIQTKVDK